jgi:hypothetical protein
MKLLVTGGRYYSNADLMFRTLAQVDDLEGPVVCLVDGGASGADSIAGNWAELRGIERRRWDADWLQYDARNGGFKADHKQGMVRNQEMLMAEQPDKVLAFPGGSGTRGMIRLAEKAGFPVEIVKDPAYPSWWKGDF